MDRAAAIAAAAAEAEAAFAEGRSWEAERTPDGARANIPSAATWKPKPKEETEETPDEAVEQDEEPIEDVEHLQLTLPEAFFLLWNLDCLTVYDNDDAMTLQDIWVSFQCAHLPPVVQPPLQFNNPFLVHYIVYHHYRSLGWVVKGGIKFCVDYLLYKRGPVFSHAEFALVICPVYEDPNDDDGSLPHSEPFTWSWLSTLNRVNSQVQKVRSQKQMLMIVFNVGLCDYTCKIEGIDGCVAVTCVLFTIFCTRSHGQAVHPCSHARVVGFVHVLQKKDLGASVLSGGEMEKGVVIVVHL